jgi:hypothetical protein
MERRSTCVYAVIARPERPLDHNALCAGVKECLFDMRGVGLARTIYIFFFHNIYMVFLAGRPPSIWSYTVYIYGFSQP